MCVRVHERERGGGGKEGGREGRRVRDLISNSTLVSATCKKL